MTGSRLFLFLVLLGFSNVANADILFLDLNNSVEEIKAARKAAAARKEKLIVIPQSNNAPQVAKLMQKIETLRKQEKTCNNTECTEKFRKEIFALAQEKSKLVENSQVNSRNLKDELLKLKGKNISSLIISGHDGTGSYSGVYGDLQANEIKAAFEAAAPIGENIRSLMLWGCYTTTLGSLEANWKKMFPNVGVIAGYDGSAPANTRLASSTYLEGFLMKEKQLTAARDAKELKRLFSSIQNVGSVHAAACIGDFYINNRHVRSYEEALKKCAADESQELFKKFECYKKAEPGCEDPPANTQSGPLREFYNFLQQNQHCGEASFDRPSPESVIRLIYSKNVIRNFSKFYQQDLDTFDNTLKSLGAPDELLIGDVTKPSRAQLMEKIKRIRIFLDQSEIDIESENFEKQEAVRIGLDSINRTLVQQSPSCVPFSWVEPHANKGIACNAPVGAAAAQEAAKYIPLKRVKARFAKFEDSLWEKAGLGQTMEELYLRQAEKAEQLYRAGTASLLAQQRGQHAPVDENLIKEAAEIDARVEELERELRKAHAPAFTEFLKSELSKTPDGSPEKQFLQRKLRLYESPDAHSEVETFLEMPLEMNSGSQGLLPSR